MVAALLFPLLPPLLADEPDGFVSLAEVGWHLFLFAALVLDCVFGRRDDLPGVRPQDLPESEVVVRPHHHLPLRNAPPRPHDRGVQPYTYLPPLNQRLVVSLPVADFVLRNV